MGMHLGVGVQQEAILHRQPSWPVKARAWGGGQLQVRFGYRRLHTLLGREGFKVNHNRVYLFFDGFTLWALLP